MRMIPLIALALVASTPLAAQTRPDPTALLEAQRQAMAPLARMDGMWRGPAWTITPNGRHDIVQTERIGLFLGGSVRLMEGRGYSEDGSVSFNALGILSFNPAANAYTLTSWARGYSGVFPFRVTADGYAWEIPAGPGATIRYTATVGDGTLREVGYLVAGDAPPRQIFEMNLRRVGDTAWPAGDPVPMR
ncbi:MAG: hypothetical protein QOD42_70 [Sphingomonadales bacterium]|jgi:hypothetical protein|nr:hypothetical protein [Sphingomonadales bacterium]